MTFYDSVCGFCCVKISGNSEFIVFRGPYQIGRRVVIVITFFLLAIRLRDTIICDFYHVRDRLSYDRNGTINHPFVFSSRLESCTDSLGD